MGDKQSGYNHYIDLIISKPELYKQAKQLASTLTLEEKTSLIARYREHEELEEKLNG